MQFGIVVIALLLCVSSSAFSFKTSSKSLTLKNAGKGKLNMLKIGDIAPDFELENSIGKKIKLSSFKNKKSVVVFFYPADRLVYTTMAVYNTYISYLQRLY